jgi:hypothetical protein
MTLSNSDIAATLNLRARKDKTFKRNFTFTDQKTGNPISLVGTTAVFTITDKDTGATVFTTNTSGFISITGASNNVYFINVPHTSINFTAKTYNWNYVVTLASGDVVEYFTGNFVLR